MLKKTISTSLIAISLLSIGNYTYAASNNHSRDDIFTATDSIEPPTPTDYDLPQDQIEPTEEPILPDPYTTGQITAKTLMKKYKGLKDIKDIDRLLASLPNTYTSQPNQTSSSRISQQTQIPQPNQPSSPQISQQNQTSQPSHTQLTVLPNTGGVSLASPLAIYSLLLLGGALVVYRPFSSINKSKV
ncbi:hypothetical protein C7J88_06120 [Staphylococcus muscae]|uniref:Gram-positive cocci surface proteins LPxTG domain-containing protein n=1 Tax=Staphylococcus muscae TaxID=1294 RepID=A0A240C9F6_9STAP|nr:hypothetical protein [Staphylococcus muscae]AVQ33766.1 hypothetical protein C7J88_06120 [Staphylococcus muscae]PNZ06274.1 hypothetical protein CD131_00645 [Staphylococcus muscae]GGA87562.1 hypothetical protein GCM10007183_09680 [Staphylococcus muscae]SNW04212.1 Uncharacterised protein [Staphylococcus muscae]